MSRPAGLEPQPAPARERVRVAGAVQGVGFRPFVYREATALGLAGWVANTPAGVVVEVEGAPANLVAFKQRLGAAAPPSAAVTRIEAEPLTPCGDTEFEIRDSVIAGSRSGRVLPDLATCPDCLRELFDPADRRFRYPFTNCTQCGPRFSIIEDLPYDRARTSMRRFAMCARCWTEYADPRNRRFHAEPNACSECGPQLALWDAQGGALAAREDALDWAVAALRRGAIVATKGLGGFHLMADARDDGAVRHLRERKRREGKPFAVMFASLADIGRVCVLSDDESALLTSTARPIVLLRRRAQNSLAPSVAPRNPLVGAMLPYTPLHHLLLAELGFPIVATSGNLSDEPIVIDEAEAVTRLAGIADCFLVHDRPIVRPLDDSVARVLAGRPQILRRARGYAPASVAEAAVPAGTMALGGHLKTTVALSTASGVVLGPHVGDLDTGEARDAHAKSRADLARLYAVTPRIVVRDLHPDYHTSAVAGRELREASDAAPRVIAVQHHVAHVAACMAEHGLEPPVLGVAWDGTGYGTDATVWGGEFLRITAQGFERVAHLRPFRLPGGEAAVREPRRSAFGLLAAVFGEQTVRMTELAPIRAFAPAERDTLVRMIAQDLNAPVTTSAGRLFDAVASLVDLRQRASYEGQAAAELEWASYDAGEERSYEFPLRIEQTSAPWAIDWEPALRAILEDLRAGIGTARIAARLHAGLGRAIDAVAARAGEQNIVLTGGCFQNARLSEHAIAALRRAGLSVYWHEKVPPNDGGLALGQVMWAARMTAGSA